MAEIKIEDIVFWIAILAIIGIIIWKLFGSPSVLEILISAVSFLMIAGLTLWRSLHNAEKKIIGIENKTTIGFIKVKNEINNLKNEINQRFDNLENLIKKEK